MSPERATPEPLVSVEEAAAFLGVSTRTGYLWAEHGRIPSYRVGALRRFRLSELDAHIQGHREGPGRRAAVSPRSQNLAFRTRRS
jgi:excisionase family DNA binding protein